MTPLLLLLWLLLSLCPVFQDGLEPWEKGSAIDVSSMAEHSTDTHLQLGQL